MMRYVLVNIMLIVLLPLAAQAAEESLAIKEDKQHVTAWNRFADNLLKMHKQRMQQHDVVTSEKLGGYMRMPEFYKEVTYRDKASGNMLSRIAWETENPDQVHVIETFVYDDNNRVIRDYAAAFLPGARNAPNQTLINLHAYNNDLHAYRSFDASNETIYESCRGTFKGKQVSISLEDYMIEDARREGANGIMGRADYQACFRGIPMDGASFMRPH